MCEALVLNIERLETRRCCTCLIWEGGGGAHTVPIRQLIAFSIIVSLCRASKFLKTCGNWKKVWLKVYWSCSFEEILLRKGTFPVIWLAPSCYNVISHLLFFSILFNTIHWVTWSPPDDTFANTSVKRPHSLSHLSIINLFATNLGMESPFCSQVSVFNK